MSHVAVVQVEIKDLEALKAACADLQLQYRENQKTCKRHQLVYGTVPEGWTKEEMGTCDHAIATGQNGAYEVGICRRRDGKPGYVLMYDDYAGGYGLMARIGEGAKKLIDRYAVNVAKRQAHKLGYACQEFAKADGSVDVVLTKKAGR
jgi:hypothetical protein